MADKDNVVQNMLLQLYVKNYGPSFKSIKNDWRNHTQEYPTHIAYNNAVNLMLGQFGESKFLTELKNSRRTWIRCKIRRNREKYYIQQQNLFLTIEKNIEDHLKQYNSIDALNITTVLYKSCVKTTQNGSPTKSKQISNIDALNTPEKFAEYFGLYNYALEHYYEYFKKHYVDNDDKVKKPSINMKAITIQDNVNIPREHIQLQLKTQMNTDADTNDDDLDMNNSNNNNQLSINNNNFLDNMIDNNSNNSMDMIDNNNSYNNINKLSNNSDNNFINNMIDNNSNNSMDMIDNNDDNRNYNNSNNRNYNNSNSQNYNNSNNSNQNYNNSNNRNYNNSNNRNNNNNNNQNYNNSNNQNYNNSNNRNNNNNNQNYNNSNGDSDSDMDIIANKSGNNLDMIDNDSDSDMDIIANKSGYNQKSNNSGYMDLAKSFPIYNINSIDDIISDADEDDNSSTFSSLDLVQNKADKNQPKNNPKGKNNRSCLAQRFDDKFKV